MKFDSSTGILTFNESLLNYDEKVRLIKAQLAVKSKAYIEYIRSQEFLAWLKNHFETELNGREDALIKEFEVDVLGIEADDGEMYNRNGAIKIEARAKHYMSPTWTSTFILLSVPNMTDEGLLKFNRGDDKDYTIVPTIVKKNGIYSKVTSKDEITFSIIYGDNKFISFDVSTGETQLSLGRKIDLIDLLNILSINDEDQRALLRESTLLEYTTKKVYANSDSLDNRYYSSLVGLEEHKTFAERLSAEKINVSGFRKQLNQTVSPSRYLNYELAGDVKDSEGKVILEKDTILTKHSINLLKENKISVFYVKDFNHREGFLAEPMMIKFLVKGTVIPLELHDCLFCTGLSFGQQITENTNLKMPIIIPKDTELSPALVKFLYENKPDMKQIIGKVAVDSAVKMTHLMIRPVFTNFSAENSDKLEFSDFLSLASLLSDFRSGLKLKYETYDIDSTFHSRLKLPHEILKNMIVEAKEWRLSNIKSKEKNSRAKEAGIAFKNPDTLMELLTDSGEVARLMSMKSQDVIAVDTSNAASYLSSLTRVNYEVKNVDTVPDSLRLVALASMGKMCPFETPQSKRIGLTNNLTGLIQIDYKTGDFLLPCYMVYHKNGKAILDLEIKLLTIEDEESHAITTIDMLKLNSQLEIQNADLIPVKTFDSYNPNKFILKEVKKDKVTAVIIDPLCMVSLTTSLLPFLGMNDAARATFASGMMKQAKALVNPEVPDVFTETYKLIGSISDRFCIRANSDGKVIKKVLSTFTVKTEDGDIQAYNNIKDVSFSDYTLSYTKDVKRVGDSFKKGDILQESSMFIDGIYAIGRNCMVGYVPAAWNYEDAILNSTTIQDNMVSYSVGTTTVEKEDKYSFDPVQFNPVRFYNPQFEPSSRLTIVSKHKVNAMADYKKEEEIVKLKEKGYIIKASTKSHKHSTLIIKSLSISKLERGDKAVNRHGNKGVSSKDKKPSQMARLRNGLALDIVYNPLGVGARMNMGQIQECHLGLIAKVLNIKFDAGHYSEASVEDVEILMSFAYELANLDVSNAIDNHRGKVPDELLEWAIKEIDNIKYWEDTFDKRGEAEIIFPSDEGDQYIQSKVLIGTNYLLKLHQESGKKLTVRGTVFTEKRNGMSYVGEKSSHTVQGQKFGYMELNALCAHGASHFIDECINGRGDNPLGVYNLAADQVWMNGIEGESIRRSTVFYRHALNVMGVDIDIYNDRDNYVDLHNKDTIPKCPNITETEADEIAASSTKIDLAKELAELGW